MSSDLVFTAFVTNPCTTAQKCTESALRALLSLTQDDKEWCQSLIVSEMTLLFLVRTIMQSHKQRSLSSRAMGVLGTEDEDDPQSLDRMCLALGVLTNLVQALKTAKNLLRKTRASAITVRDTMLIHKLQ